MLIRIPNSFTTPSLLRLPHFHHLLASTGHPYLYLSQSRFNQAYLSTQINFMRARRHSRPSLLHPHPTRLCPSPQVPLRYRQTCGCPLMLVPTTESSSGTRCPMSLSYRLLFRGHLHCRIFSHRRVHQHALHLASVHLQAPAFVSLDSTAHRARPVHLDSLAPHASHARLTVIAATKVSLRCMQFRWVLLLHPWFYNGQRWHPMLQVSSWILPGFRRELPSLSNWMYTVLGWNRSMHLVRVRESALSRRQLPQWRLLLSLRIRDYSPIMAAAFPRTMSVSAKGRILLLTTRNANATAAARPAQSAKSQASTAHHSLGKSNAPPVCPDFSLAMEPVLRVVLLEPHFHRKIILHIALLHLLWNLLFLSYLQQQPTCL